MFAAHSWLTASFHASRRWLRPEHSSGAGPARRGRAGLVPVRRLHAAHRERIRAHLLSLDAGDRRMRFGHAASDPQIRRYVERLDFARDEILGIFNRRLELIALAHLAYPQPQAACAAPACAEFGVSVVARARGRGFGARLFARAAEHARNAGVGQLVIQALGANAAMLRIARKAGATVVRSGPEAEARLALPPATFDSRMRQWREARLGETDYRIKRDSKRFWDWIGRLQEVRQSVRAGRPRTGR